MGQITENKSFPEDEKSNVGEPTKLESGKEPQLLPSHIASAIEENKRTFRSVDF